MNLNNFKMKGYTSKWDKARCIALSFGYKETDKGFQNMRKQIFAKLVVGSDRTIGKVNGKLKIS